MWAAQTSFGERLQGRTSSFGASLQLSLIQTLPWIPVTLAVVYLATRFPITRNSWRRRLPLHLLAAIVLAVVANALVTLGFWIQSGQFRGLSALIRGGLLWAGIRMQIALLIYAAVAAITQFVQYYRDARTRELQLTRARLQALNAQIRPHFLFNTLHAIGQLWRSGRNDEAELVLDQLGELFRRVNRTTNESEVTLGEELEMVRAYLGIEQVRFKDRMHVEICAADELHDLLVPPLILQPIVENAVRHGKAEDIRVSAVRENGRLVLTVADNGFGFDSNGNGGTGLSNTRERLQHLYGERGALEIAPQTPGTIVRIVIPAHE